VQQLVIYHPRAAPSCNAAPDIYIYIDRYTQKHATRHANSFQPRAYINSFHLFFINKKRHLYKENDSKKSTDDGGMLICSLLKAMMQ
jgi:hypothetical protein